MSSLRPESHLAQQFRRDKLRIQQHFQEFPNNIDQFNMDLVQVRSVRNANMLDEPAVYSSQIPNFEVEPSRLMLQQYGSFPHSLVDNNDIHNSPQKEVHVGLGNWRNSAPHQVTDNWIVNYSNNSLPTDHLNNNVDHAYHQYMNTVMHHTPSPLYQNTSMISSHVSDMASLMQQQQTDNQVTWVGNVCELESWKNPQSLSLSLSSNAQTKSKVHVSQFEEGCSSDNNIIQCVKYSKPSIISRDSGKSLEEVVGLGMGASKSTTSYRNVGPLGPFTGYATILKSSRFLKTAQQLLDEFCCIPGLRTCDASTSADNNETGIACEASNAGSSLLSSMFHVSNENGADWGVGRSFGVSNSRPDYQQKKAKLLYMQEEVIKRYKQYHQQMQMVFSSFESVAGLSSATPYISLALKSVSKHFRCLNNSISEQLKRISEVLGEDSSLPTTSTSSKLIDTNMASLRCMDQSLQKNKHGRGTPGFLEPRQHAWRPQRGFPESSITILKAWLFEHFLHPYPTDTDKHMLATQTGLSRNQVSNWFINARVRVWKPMVEEIHTLDKTPTTTSENYSKNEGTSGTKGSSSQVRVDKSMNQVRVDKSMNELGMHSIPENQYQRIEEWSHEKRSKIECQMSSSMDGNGTVMSFLPYRSSGAEVGGIGSVSLTLGLRHGVEGVQQQLQEEQLRHHFGGQMIHDFVG